MQHHQMVGKEHTSVDQYIFSFVMDIFSIYLELMMSSRMYKDVCARRADSITSRVIPCKHSVSHITRTHEVTDVVWVKIYSAYPNLG